MKTKDGENEGFLLTQAATFLVRNLPMSGVVDPPRCSALSHTKIKLGELVLELYVALYSFHYEDFHPSSPFYAVLLSQCCWAHIIDSEKER